MSRAGMRLWERIAPIVVPFLIIIAVTEVLYFFKDVVHARHLVFFYLLPTAFVAMLYGSVLSMICAIDAILVAAFFLCDPTYTLYVSDSREVGELITFAGVALIGAKCTAELMRPSERIRIKTWATTGGNAAQRLFKMVPPRHDKGQIALEGIVNAGHRTSEIIDGFRALFTKSDQSQQLVDINEITRAVLESMSSELADHQIESRSEMTSELPQVYGNKSQLQEVVSNLIVNAIEAMETTPSRDRVVRVRTELCDDKAVAVVVKDSGPGIDERRFVGCAGPFAFASDRQLGTAELAWRPTWRLDAKRF